VKLTRKALIVSGGIVIVALVFVVNVFAHLQSAAPTESQQSSAACTMEAKICPNGSAVGRVGSDCAFTECPSSEPVVKE